LEREEREADREALRTRWEEEEARVTAHAAAMRKRVWEQQEVVRQAELKRRSRMVVELEGHLGSGEVNAISSPQYVRIELIQGLFTHLGGSRGGALSSESIDSIGLLKVIIHGPEVTLGPWSRSNPWTMVQK